MSDAPLREPSEYGTGKQPSRQPVVINKRDLVRMDRFPPPSSSTSWNRGARASAPHC